MGSANTQEGWTQPLIAWTPQTSEPIGVKALTDNYQSQHFLNFRRLFFKSGIRHRPAVRDALLAPGEVKRASELEALCG